MRLVRRLLATFGLLTGVLLGASPLHADLAVERAPAARIEPGAPVQSSGLPPLRRQFSSSRVAGERWRTSFPRVLFQLQGEVGDGGEIRFRVQAKQKQVFVFEYRF